MVCNSTKTDLSKQLNTVYLGVSKHFVSKKPYKKIDKIYKDF